MRDKLRKYTEQQRERDRLASKRYREKHPEKVRAKYRAWAAANPDKVNTEKRRAQTRAWNAAHPWNWRERKFGLSNEAFTALVESQNFRCASCETDLRLLKTKNIHVDHCHVTNRVRGVLCNSCNSALGFAKEDKYRLHSLISYLERFQNGMS